jgi:hypothetical protein
MIGYGVVRDAPRYPYVIPTLVYRNLVKPVWKPLRPLVYGIWGFVYSLFFNEAASASTATTTAGRFATKVVQTAHMRETLEPDIGFGADEVI